MLRRCSWTCPRHLTCLPHDLLLMKLQAYGLSVKACALISSYLSGRRQQVRLGPHCSDWCDIINGVPQGSILGPLLFNIFINDIFHVLDRTSLHNYADDNTLSYSHNNPNTLKQHIQVDCVAVLQWFEENNMQANPDKFQAISFVDCSDAGTVPCVDARLVDSR